MKASFKGTHLLLSKDRVYNLEYINDSLCVILDKAQKFGGVDIDTIPVSSFDDWYFMDTDVNGKITMVDSSKYYTIDEITATVNGYEEVVAMDQGREPWPVYFMRLAQDAADRTTCKSRTVGAVFVKDKIDIMKGYNGVPPGFEHPKTCKRKDMGCKSGERLDLCPCNHAERNAINNAAAHGIALAGSTVYVTTKPCFSCMGDMSVVRVNKVVFLNHYDHEVTDTIARKGNIELVDFKTELQNYVYDKLRSSIKRV